VGIVEELVEIWPNEVCDKWECIGEVRERTGKLRRGVVGRLDEGNVHENKTAQDRCLCLQSVETLKA